VTGPTSGPADPYPPVHHAPSWGTPRPRVEGFAVAALVTGLLFWAWPTAGALAVAFGVTALVALRRNGRRGRGLAVAGIVLGSVGGLTALVVTALVVLSLTEGPLGTVDAPVTATPDRLDVGHCVRALPADGTVDEVVVVPCDEPHEAQVRARVELPESGWPGQDEADALVARACLRADHYVRTGEAPDVTWAPLDHAWELGDRVGLCLQRVR